MGRHGQPGAEKWVEREKEVTRTGLLYGILKQCNSILNGVRYERSLLVGCFSRTYSGKPRAEAKGRQTCSYMGGPREGEQFRMAQG